MAIHRSDLSKALVEPVSMAFEGPDGYEWILWVAAKKDDFFIVCDLESGNYGTGFINILGKPVFPGFSGSIQDAYEDIVTREG